MFQKENLHHAYFIEGDRLAVLPTIESFLSDAFGIIRQGHPDVHYAEYESFGIDESRGLQDMQSMKPLRGDRKIFIIATGSITSEAQNSLLKVFEEPTPGTHFFIISTSQRILLPTLRSRLFVHVHDLGQDKSKNTEIQTDAAKFITASPKDRLAYVANIIEEKDKAGAEGFLNALVVELHKKLPKNSAAIKEILSLVTYLKDRSPSLKLILERAALLELY